MSIRHSLLALLSEQPTHGYGLKSGFEKSTAGTWPLNVGQVYSTLNRLERDGLVEAQDIDGGPRQTGTITAAGRAALAVWYAKPVLDDPPPRDELALKVLLPCRPTPPRRGPLRDPARPRVRGGAWNGYWTCVIRAG